ncbi:MAG: UDP-N-acetylmuramoyl-tripeptide--D-alanyl-D-alanine ligase [Vicinamibacterales bacterium]
MSAAPVRLTAARAAAAMAGSLVAGPAGAAVGGVSIDTRTLRAGDVYVAIIGERLDGHRFIGEALRAGAAGVVVSDPSSLPPDVGDAIVAVRVDDTTRALQRLATHIRRASGAQVVAITGSAGKTTTKELTANLLASRYRVFRNQGNFNNHIGLPLSLIELRHGPEIAVVELGMNHAGEIRALVDLAQPDVRVWTLVAEVHSAFFPSLEAIADAKAEILAGATPESVVVANAADPLVMARVSAASARLVTFGIGVPAEVSAAGVVDRGLAGTRATVTTPWGTSVIDVPLLGRGHLANALAAMAVAGGYGVPLDAMVERLAAARPAARRGEVWRLASGVTLVDDSYNSNPRALQRTLEAVAAERACSRRLAVLGEMLELGDEAVALHEACGRAAARAGLAHLVTVGGAPALAMAKAAAAAGMPAGAVRHAATSAEAADAVVPMLRGGDVVLVKGSRGVRTDLVADRIKEAGA